MDAKNGHKNNEKQLFHGTDADSVPHVNRNGFNRSYAGKNGKEASNLADQNEVNDSSIVDYSHQAVQNHRWQPSCPDQDRALCVPLKRRLATF